MFKWLRQLGGGRQTMSDRTSQAVQNAQAKAHRHNCARCGVAVLSQSQFLAACKEAGFRVDDSGNVSLRLGGLAGPMDEVSRRLTEQQAEQQARHDAIENTKGFQCSGCRALYCMSCLFNHATPHPHGGKACPKCGGKFTYFET